MHWHQKIVEENSRRDAMKELALTLALSPVVLFAVEIEKLI